MEIKKDYDISHLNTFGVHAKAYYFVEINREEEIPALFSLEEFKNNKKLFLGGGSNVLFTKDFDGIVILNKLKGIEIIKETKEDVVVRGMSGEIWHDLVSFAVEKGYWGIENLAFVPGTVGAAPMQNIGAYGAELKNTLESVETIEIETGNKKVFNKEECQLGYRDSVFKNNLKDKFFIVAVTLKLSKVAKQNTSYKFLSEYLEKNNILVKNPKDISEAVTTIRKSKLPDPKVIGNAGSFFKNIFLTSEKIIEIKKKYPDMPFFEEGSVTKIPAAWLIEQCGPAIGTSWKGHRIGNVGIHNKQALVIVNHGGATGGEVKALAMQIVASVKEKFGLELVPEVNLI